MAEEGRAKGKQEVAIVSGLLSVGSLILLLRAPLHVYFSAAKVFLPCKIEALFLNDEESCMMWRKRGSFSSLHLFGEDTALQICLVLERCLRRGSPSL